MFLMFLDENTLQNSGYVEGNVSETTESAVNDAMNGTWDLIVTKVATLLNSIATDFMSSFSPDMTNFLKMFGYTGNASDYAAISWAQAQDVSLNLFGIFAIAGYVLAIIILVVSLLKVSVANVVDTKDSTGTLLARFVITFLMITYANSIVYFLMKFPKVIWDKIYALNDTNVAAYNLEVDSSQGVFTNICGIDVSYVSPILTFVMFIIIVFDLIKLVVAVAEKYIILGVLYIAFPLSAGTFVSRNTSNVFQAHFRMMLSECIMLLMNVWCVSALFTIITHIGGIADMSGVTQLLYVIAFEKISLKLEKHAKNLGLNNAVAGGNLLDEIVAAGSHIINFPGMAARSVNATVRAANMPSAILANAAMRNGDYAKAMDYANAQIGAENRVRAASDVMRGMQEQNLSPDQIAKMDVSGAMLNSRGNNVSGYTAASAVKAASGGRMEQNLAEGFGTTADKVTLGDTAIWGANAWHMRANVDGNDVGIKLTTPENADPSKSVIGTIKDSNGRTWNVMLDTQKPIKDGRLNEDILQAMDKDRKIVNPLIAEQLTGIKNQYGVRINPDTSITLLNKDGTAGEIKYVANGRNRYVPVFDDSVIAKAMGMPTDSYMGASAASYMDSNSNIRDAAAAAAFTGVANEHGMHHTSDEDGNEWYQPLHATKKMRVDPASFVKEAETDSGDQPTENTGSSHEGNAQETGYTTEQPNSDGQSNEQESAASEEGHGYTKQSGGTGERAADNESDTSSDATFNNEEAETGEPGEEPGAEEEIPNTELPFTDENADQDDDPDEYDDSEFDQFEDDPLGYEQQDEGIPQDSEMFSANGYGEAEDVTGENEAVRLTAEEAREKLGLETESGILMRTQGTYSLLDENGEAEDVEHLYNISNPYGVKQEGDDLFRVYDTPDGSESHLIHLNENDTYSNVDENGVVEEAQHIAELGDDINVIDEGDGTVVAEKIEDEAYAAPDKQPVTLSGVKVNGDGDYTGYMTLRGIYENDPQRDAKLKVRIGNAKTKKATERVVSTFKPAGSDEEIAILADRKDVGDLVSDSAGMTITNQTIGRLMMGMSEDQMQKAAKEHNIQEDLGDKYVVDDSGTTVSRMNKDFDRLSNEDRKTHQALKNHYDNTYGVINTKYSENGQKLYNFSRGASSSYNRDDFSTAKSFAEKFAAQLKENENVVDVKILRGKYADNFKVTIEDPETLEQKVHTYRNVANLDDSYVLKKGSRYLKADGERWVQTSVKTPRKKKSDNQAK